LSEAASQPAGSTRAESSSSDLEDIQALAEKQIEAMGVVREVVR